jgi:hypothetical protein
MLSKSKLSRHVGENCLLLLHSEVVAFLSWMGFECKLVDFLLENWGFLNGVQFLGI